MAELAKLQPVAVPSQMELMTWDDVKSQVDQRLVKLYRKQAQLAAAVDPLYAKLLTEMGLFIGRGGKRLRPYLAYLSYVGYGGSDLEAMWPVAISQEVIHNFGLIHDDIIDHDTARYNGPNIAGRYQTILKPFATSEAGISHLANSMALLAGDINHGLAYDLIADCSLPAATRLAITSRIRQIIFETIGGQQLDVLIPWLPDAEISQARLLAVIRHKTASYSFEMPLQVGAMAAGASPQSIKAIAQVAEPLGLAFQLRDDILGVYGDEKQTGKPVLSDLREGKRTLLIQYGLEMAPATDASLLHEYLGNPDVGYAQLDQVREVLEKCGAKAGIEQLAQASAQAAQRGLDNVGWTPVVQQALTRITEFAASRQT